MFSKLMSDFYDYDFDPLNANASTFYGSGSTLPDFQDNQTADGYGSNTNQHGGGDFFTGSQDQGAHQSPMNYFPPATTGNISYSEHVSLRVYCLLNGY
jgi:hypothetical protein